MATKREGLEIDCIELYPWNDGGGAPTRAVSIVLVSKRRTVATDLVLRRDHQTLLGLLQEVAGLVRHLLGDST